MLETLHFLFFLLTIFWPRNLYSTASYFVSSHWHVDRSSEGWKSFFHSHIMRFLSFIFLLTELEKENLYIRKKPITIYVVFWMRLWQQSFGNTSYVCVPILCLNFRYSRILHSTHIEVISYFRYGSHEYKSLELILLYIQTLQNGFEI